MAERRTINGELCERVEMAADLKQFDVVHVRCAWCAEAAFHRGWLSERVTGTSIVDARGRRAIVDAWVIDPVAHGDRVAVTDSCVTQGRVWRVVDEARDDGWDAFEMEQARVDAAVRAIRVATFEPERIVKVPG